MNMKNLFQSKFSAGLILQVVGLLISGCLGPILLPFDDPVPVAPSGRPTKELLLDEQPFPPGWQVDPCEPYCDDKLSQSSRSFGRIGIPGHVLQDVFHFQDEQDAQAKHQRYEETTPHQPPPEIAYRSPIADAQYLRCGIDDPAGVSVCRAGRRYGTYVIYLFFDIDQGLDDGLHYDEVETILRALDEHISTQLEIPIPIMTSVP